MYRLLLLIGLTSVLHGCAIVAVTSPCQTFCAQRGGYCAAHQDGYRDYSADGGWFLDRPTVYRCVFPGRRWN